MNELLGPLMTAEDAARFLGCHPRTLLRKAREGAVPCLHVFGRVRFTESMLCAWLESQGYNPTAVRVA